MGKRLFVMWAAFAILAFAGGAHLLSETKASTSGKASFVQVGMLTALQQALNSPSLRGTGEWLSSWATLSSMPNDERLALIMEENEWKNSLVMWMFPESMQESMPHWVQSWLRCWIMCTAVYFVVGAVWSYYAYFAFGDVLFTPGTMPGWRDVAEQMKVSNIAIPLYSLLPMAAEMAAEKGWTKCYPRIENVGLPMYVFYFFAYMSFVEFGVYWVHRELHEIKWAYKYLHYDHHKYNKEHTLSPFAGLAFHPVDGILQALPYVLTLFLVPMHFLTHELLLFATGVWTANIHDNIHGKVWPIMGAKYHTIHHTNYKTNYGHYFIFMDQIFGTLQTPEEHDEAALAKAH